MSKWTEELTSQLKAYVGDETPVSQETVAGAAEALGVSPRSISSKLRKEKFEVELASARNKSVFTPEQADTLATFVTENSGTFTYAQIAEAFEGGQFNAKQIQGKILSMELTDHVAPAPKKETVRTYTPEEEAVFVEMAGNGAFLEEIADALGKPLPSVRGKALSLLKTEEISVFPKQRDTKGPTRKDPLAEIDVAAMTCQEIADAISEMQGKEQTVRGVRTMLTRRGLAATDWNGAERKAKAEAKAAE